MASEPSSKITVAICGAGVASLCLAYGLLKHPHIKVDIYEASPAARDEGAAIGLGSNAQEALRLIAPELRDALDEAGGTRMSPSGKVYVGTGPDAGTHIGDMDHPHAPQIVVARAPWAATLRKLLPDGTIQQGKKLVDTTEHDSGPVALAFADGSTAKADCLVGCDGINSTVRAFVLGADSPVLSPSYTGGHGFRLLVPLDAAVAAFGPEYFQHRTQKIHVGDGGALLTDFSDDGRSVQLIAGFTSSTPWPHAASWVAWPRDEFASSLARWGDVGDAMAGLYLAQDTLVAAASRFHAAAPTYVRGRLCVAGDAAQTFTPARGAGAGQAIEDALVLCATLPKARSGAEVAAALAAYDAVRRPRRTMVAEMSAHGSRLLTGREPGVGLDVDKWREQLAVWNKEIYSYDLRAGCAEAVGVMESMAR